ncbi:hypothetical protein TNCV_4047991 [Trichonephila clavipes]|nr:hypothetical protein TNCV_4047991 [Trichonephila clavipes]
MTGENISRQDYLLKLAVELGADFREAREQSKQRKNTKGSLPKSTTDAYQLTSINGTQEHPSVLCCKPNVTLSPRLHWLD